MLLELRKATAILGACACGWMVASGEGGGGFSSGVDPMKSVGDITEPEAQQLCEAAIGYAYAQFTPAKIKPAYCTATALLFSLWDGSEFGEETTSTPSPDAVRTACNFAYDTCMKADIPQEVQSIFAQDPATTCAAQQPSTTASCTATVAEYDQCVNDLVATLRGILNSLPTCAQVANALSSMTEPDFFDFQEPASCAAFESKCPGVLPDVSGLDGFSGLDDLGDFDFDDE